MIESTVCLLASKISLFEIKSKSIPNELVISWVFEKPKKIVEFIEACNTFQESQFFFPQTALRSQWWLSEKPLKIFLMLILISANLLEINIPGTKHRAFDCGN